MLPEHLSEHNILDRTFIPAVLYRYIYIHTNDIQHLQRCQHQTKNDKNIYVGRAYTTCMYDMSNNID